MELVTLEAEDVTDDLNPESRRDIQFFEESQYAYQKEFLSQMLADALEAGRALGGEYFSGPTSRGMGQEEMIQIAMLIDNVLTNIDNESIIHKVKDSVVELCNKFQLYPHLNNQ